MSRMGFYLVILMIFPFLWSLQAEACTTAIISGKCTVDGRPLLWKHRDSGFKQNKIMYFDDGLYEYKGLVNTVDTLGREIWAGYNSKGFAIMNSASYNLKPESDTTSLKDREGVVMKKALQTCTTVDDFEELLQEWSRPIGVEANFGVIDAHGGAAYFETSNFNYHKINVNDPAIAPYGYVIRTNHSFNGKHDDGYGYIRYMAAERLLYNAAATNNLSARFLLQTGSRALKHALTGKNLRAHPLPREDKEHFVLLQDFIPRYSSVSTVVVHGVKKQQSPQWTTMWTILGFPLTSVAVPVWIQTGKALSDLLKSNEGAPAPLCDYALALKERCFPIQRGSGYKYLQLSALLNAENSGIMQVLEPLENRIINRTQAALETWQKEGTFDTSAAKTLQKEFNQVIRSAYQSLLDKEVSLQRASD